ncbi:MAG: hypothetical protein ABIB97_03080 [Patescibacteria group bacterium]
MSTWTIIDTPANAENLKRTFRDDIDFAQKYLAAMELLEAKPKLATYQIVG